MGLVRNAMMFVLLGFLVFSGVHSAFAAKSGGTLKKESPTWIKDIKLTTEQRGELKKVTTTHNRRISEKSNELEKATALFRGSMSKNIPESEIRDRFKAMMDAKSSLAKAKLDKALAMRKLLTSEQLTVFRKRK